MKRLAAGLIFSLLAIASYAEVEPVKGSDDSRIRNVLYNPADVIRVQTYFGVRTLVRMPLGEKIIDASGGDPNAWDIPNPIGRGYFWAQPKMDNPDSNYIVITEDAKGVQRDYNFILMNVVYKDQKVKKPYENSNITLTLKITHASDKPSEQKMQQQKMLAEKEEIKKELNPADPLKVGMKLNFDYWACGDDQVKPTAAYDNGLFTILSFANGRQIPSVHEVKEDGSESLIYHSMSGLTTMVIPKVIKKVVLRVDPYVACVQNYSYDPSAIQDFVSGTASTNVVRELKGNGNE